MSEPETFVARWSRLKRQTGRTAEEQPPEPSARPATGRAPAAADEAEHAGKGEPPEPAFDPASLPPVEFDHRRHRYPGLPAVRRARRADAGGPAPRMDHRSGHSRLHWHCREPVGLHGSERDTGVRASPGDGRRGQAGRPGHGQARRNGRTAGRGQSRAPWFRCAMQHTAGRSRPIRAWHTRTWHVAGNCRFCVTRGGGHRSAETSRCCGAG